MLNAYQRPLFRQAGGPAGVAALPPPPPAGVASLPQQDPQALIEAMAQETGSEMEAVGQDYVINMVNRLDTAEDFKQVIDSLRGNEMPMEDRYGELAEYVGEEDAVKTPESVLAMVQPVIMMTEEGNVDSGIGELMQGVAGDVDMMTEGGQLTDMGQGVGSLMAANQGPPPPQQFADGGGVQHLFTGGTALGEPVQWGTGGSPSYPNLEPYEMLQRSTVGSPDLATAPTVNLNVDMAERFPEYQKIFRDVLKPEEEKSQTKANILFRLAQAALNYAGGTDPSGESTGELSPAGRLAEAARGLPEGIAEEVARGRAAERAADVGALQATIQETTGERTLAAQIRSDELRTGAQIRAQIDIAASELRQNNEIAEADRLSDEAIARANAELQAFNYRGTRADLVRRVMSEEMLKRYAMGHTMPDFEVAVSILYGQPQVGVGGVPTQAEIPTVLIIAARSRAKLQGMQVPEYLTEGALTAPPQPGRGLLNPNSTLGMVQKAQGGPVQHFQFGTGPDGTPAPPPLPPVPEGLTNASFNYITKKWEESPDFPREDFETKVARTGIRAPGVDLTLGVGARSFLVSRIINPVSDVISNLVTGRSSVIGDEYDAAVTAIGSLDTLFQLEMNKSIEGRDNPHIRELVKDLSVAGGTLFKGQSRALDKFRESVNMLESAISTEEHASTNAALTDTERSNSFKSASNLKQLVAEYERLIEIFENKEQPPQDEDLNLTLQRYLKPRSQQE